MKSQNCQLSTTTIGFQLGSFIYSARDIEFCGEFSKTCGKDHKKKPHKVKRSSVNYK